MQGDQPRQEIVLSFYRVRQALGYLGFVLPFTLIVGGLLSKGVIEPSISDYYHTILRDIFVGTMIAIGIFLICYTGYRRQAQEHISDDWVTTLAGVFALCVALFPNEIVTPDQSVDAVPQLVLGVRNAALMHYVSALLFLLCIAYVCLFKFARTAKPVRRRIYHICGIVIIAATVGTVVSSYYRVLGSEAARAIVNEHHIVLWFEAIGVWAFSIAWLTKGRADLSLIKAFRRPSHPAQG